ncbi:hypothetical protein AB395_00003079 [Sinorhizobium fredii CCBAU 45436]|nr:hypothetical protein AB395_00003079 [Sinorhizobium fredii CCBAU 45436]
MTGSPKRPAAKCPASPPFAAIAIYSLQPAFLPSILVKG